MLLAGDIGGTKTNLAIFSVEQGLHDPIMEATFPSGNYASLEAVVLEFFEQIKPQGFDPTTISQGSFGVAGPVMNGQATITNLPWVMDEAQLAATLHIPAVELLNDLESIASAVPFLEPGDVYTLNQGQPVPGGPMVVIAPGTGLGEAYLTWDGRHYRAHASEGGHKDFAPTNAMEIGLLQYLQTKYNHVSYERVCSGIGIPNIYNYLRDSGQAEEPAWLAKKLVGLKDPTPIIITTALDDATACDICTTTLETFIDILARESGNMALNILASGGVYLGGGIPPRILAALKQGRFVVSFHRKGRFTEMLSKFPVHVILNPKVALLGAAYHGRNV